jgi:hypothetical protein
MQLKLAAGLCHLIGQRRRDIVGVPLQLKTCQDYIALASFFDKMVRT